jgi:hypothetical protein
LFHIFSDAVEEHAETFYTEKASRDLGNLGGIRMVGRSRAYQTPKEGRSLWSKKGEHRALEPYQQEKQEGCHNLHPMNNAFEDQSLDLRHLRRVTDQCSSRAVLLEGFDDRQTVSCADRLSIEACISAVIWNPMSCSI